MIDHREVYNALIFIIIISLLSSKHLGLHLWIIYLKQGQIFKEDVLSDIKRPHEKKQNNKAYIVWKNNSIIRISQSEHNYRGHELNTFSHCVFPQQHL